MEEVSNYPDNILHRYLHYIVSYTLAFRISISQLFQEPSIFISVAYPYHK